ncbi:serine hydrolase domain-containing protein [Prosthecobacter vanneervenii]|uniref:CubicO group peptidase (Beta-lactamase class C family) n=1 Tax=Prosthecobacter vanneervenii TaxID=48466 RepID=A0A7W8DL16_9BACT|nr:serine hydrolase domain-containing protein [Prosthecobacter vanneervenii]MBB5033411.1 CubicO group peptidase (beta-lactamase class C family) [Prosthecobacter vanneervenii]
MHRFFCTALSSLLLFPALLPALDAAKLAAIHPAMEAAVKAKQAAGIVTLVMEKGKVVHHDAAGMADVAKGRAMEKDALFWIASMTKSINGSAVMVLVDEGKLSLDEPASKWLPELGKVKLADGSAPEKPITLRMLLSHTAGIAFPRRAPSDGAISLKAYVASLLKTPLAFQPGSAYEYGFGPTVAGRIIELVSGMKYDAFLQAKIFAPLGMKDTMFNPDDAHRARIARTYKMDDETHELVPGYNPFVTSDASVTHMVEPSGGLFSTAADMGRFYSMIANGGELDGVRVLSEKSVKDMTAPVSASGKMLNYACGWQVNIETQRVNSQMPVGSFGHGGAFATNGCIDPQSGIVTVYMVQNVLVPDSGKPKDAFQHLVMEAAGITVKPVATVAKKTKP